MFPIQPAVRNCPYRPFVKVVAPSLEIVPTSSLEAFKALTLAREGIRKGDDFERIRYCKKAIDIDPEFAMAYFVLSVGYSNTGQLELSRKAAKRAYELKEQLSEREKLIINASYPDVNGEIFKRIETLKTLKREYPRETPSINNLGVTYSELGDFEKALEEQSGRGTTFRFAGPQHNANLKDRALRVRSRR